MPGIVELLVRSQPMIAASGEIHVAFHEHELFYDSPHTQWRNGNLRGWIKRTRTLCARAGFFQ